MKTITLQQAYKILTDCSGVIVEDNIINPKLGDGMGGGLEDDPNHLFMALDWEESGLMFEQCFLEGQNQEVNVVGSSMFLINELGDEVQLTILSPLDLEKALLSVPADLEVNKSLNLREHLTTLLKMYRDGDVPSDFLNECDKVLSKE